MEVSDAGGKCRYAVVFPSSTCADPHVHRYAYTKLPGRHHIKSVLTLTTLPFIREGHNGHVRSRSPAGIWTSALPIRLNNVFILAQTSEQLVQPRTDPPAHAPHAATSQLSDVPRSVLTKTTSTAANLDLLADCHARKQFLHTLMSPQIPQPALRWR